MKENKAEKFVNNLNNYGRGTEETFMTKAWLPTVGEDRTPPTGSSPTTLASSFTSNPHSKAAQRLQKDVLDRVDFFDDGIASTENTDFIRGFLLTGSKDKTENSLVKAMAKSPSLTNLRPDFVYGYWADWPGLETPSDAPENLITGFEISSLTKLPFCTVEAKADKGSRSEADDQNRRNGAYCIRAHQFLIDHVHGFTLVLDAGSDKETAIFMKTASPACVVIWLNWVEFGDKLDSVGQRPCISTWTSSSRLLGWGGLVEITATGFSQHCWLGGVSSPAGSRRAAQGSLSRNAHDCHVAKKKEEYTEVEPTEV